MTATVSVEERLTESPVYRAFAEHPFFAAVDSADVTKEQAAQLIEQWWHPLHYFPTFLARCVAVLPDIAAKSAITRILNQEAGGGVAARAHEVIYVKSMEKAGFDGARVTGTEPHAETAALVAGYERASARHETALGFIFATETTDLLMVSSIGKAVERATGLADNKWVTIHVAQEPDHVEQAKAALLGGLTPEQEDAVLAAAEEMWRLWTGFFDRLSAESRVGADS
ncbi:TenA family transcriptional regulator [Amycolatopsis nivea]